MASKLVIGEPEPVPGEEVLKALDLSHRIHNAAEPFDVSAEEVVYIKERISAHFTLSIVVGAAWEMLEAR